MMRVALVSGAVAALLLWAPAGGQGLGLSHDFEFGPLLDDLVPDEGMFTSPSGAPSRQQLRYVGAQLAGHIAAAEFSMIAIADPLFDDNEMSDFGVFLIYPPPRGASSIRVVELPVPSIWYQRVFEYRNHALLQEAGSLGPSFVRAGLEASLQQYTDMRDEPEDNLFMRAHKWKVRNRVAERKPDICEIPVEEALAKRLEGAVGQVVMRARHGPSTEIAAPWEATMHYRDFFFSHGYNTARAGADLLNNGRPGLLVDMVLAMRDYCRTKEPRMLGTLREKLERLEKRLPEDSTYEQPPIPKN